MDTASGYIRALDGSPLYCVYHSAVPVPVDAPAKRHWPIVVLPSLFEERKSAYAALRRLAERLALAGHPVLRFDYRGSGESGGAPALRRWSHLAEDCAVARKTLARLSGQRDSVLLGLRLGATLALQETLRVGGEAVIALAPVIKGANQVRLWKMRSKIRAELTTPEAQATAAQAADDGTLDFDGYEVGGAFFDDVSALDLARDPGALSCSGLILQLSHRTEPSAENAALKTALGSRARLECLRCEPFWDKVDDVDTRPVEDAILKFL